jgi:hypothetical protein
MDACTLAATLLHVGEHYNTSTADLRRLVQKLVTLSLRYVSRRDLWAELFGADEFVHWELVEKHAANANVLGDLSAWLALLGVCAWPNLREHEGEIVAGHASLANMRKNMRDTGLDPGDGWTLACHALLLTLVRGLPGLHSLEMLTCQFFKRNTHAACMELLAKQADASYTPEEQAATVRFILDKATVNVTLLSQNLAIVRARREERELCLKLKSVVAVKGRPRLRERVSSTLNTLESKTQADIALSTWESYAGWSYLHTLPTTLSEAIKHRLYFLSSQTTWEWPKHLHMVLSSAGPILAKIAQYPVTNPDLPIILKVVGRLKMDGSAPFPELTQFRVECFAALPVTHVQRMTLSEILQAYVAIYQAPSIWKDVFRSVVGVISVNLIRACEGFVKANPFAAEAFMQLLVKS